MNHLRAGIAPRRSAPPDGPWALRRPFWRMPAASAACLPLQLQPPTTRKAQDEVGHSSVKALGGSRHRTGLTRNAPGEADLKQPGSALHVAASPSWLHSQDFDEPILDDQDVQVRHFQPRGELRHRDLLGCATAILVIVKNTIIPVIDNPVSCIVRFVAGPEG